MNGELISTLCKLVENACKAEANAYGYGIWSHHIRPMMDIARNLALQVGADEETVTIAVLLHDYAGIKDRKNRKDHHIHGAKEAERILNESEYPQDKTDLVKKCILSHRSSIKTDRATNEEKCVADADAIAHIEQVPSLLYSAYAQLGKGIDEGVVWLREKLKRDWAKLSDAGKEMVKDKYETAMKLLR